MTFKDLKKLVEQHSIVDYEQELTTTNPKLYTLLQRLRHKDFWIFDKERHKHEYKRTNGDCCLNHILGLPEKEGKSMPMFPYEQLVFNALFEEDGLSVNGSFTDRHVWVKKATGLGITELALRIVIWLCTKDDSLRGKQFVLVTGPNITLAVTLVKRLKAIFLRHNITFSDKETVLELNGCHIECYPSHHVDAFRALESPKFILLDECDFFPVGQQQAVRDVAERYIAKSNPYIMMVSTPNAPEGLFEHIENEPEDKCIYKRLKLDYRYGLGNIYTELEIQKAMRSPSFGREYNLRYLGVVGNVFLEDTIQKAISFGREMDIYQRILQTPELLDSIGATCYVGIDPGFAASKFGIVLVGCIDDKVCVLETIELDKPLFEDAIDAVGRSMLRFRCNTSNTKILVDASAPSIISHLKSQVGEDTDYTTILQYRKKYKMRDLYAGFSVIPCVFNTSSKREMLQNLKELMDNQMIVFDAKRHEKLLLSLRTAVAESENMQLDKQLTVSHDILDAMCLACKRVSVNREDQKYDFKANMAVV